MPIGIVSDDDFSAEIERLKNPKSSYYKEKISPNDTKLDEPKEEEQSAEIKQIERGRGTNDVEVPETLRALIASTAIESGRTEALALAREFGISPSSVSAYTHGATSTATYHTPDIPLKKKVNNTKERLGKIARGKLALSLRHITEEKIADAKLRDIASVAASMAAVVKQMEPERDSGNHNINIVLYAPKVKSESTYEVIEAASQE